MITCSLEQEMQHMRALLEKEPGEGGREPESFLGIQKKLCEK